jgi:two-component system, repressor protein LuxO
MASVAHLPSQDRVRPHTVSVVVIDADAAHRRSIAGMIAERSHGRFHARPCANSAEASAAVRAEPGAIVIADLDTIGGAAHIVEFAAPTIATSANGSLATAVAAMKCGAKDFLPKPIGAKALMERLEASLGDGRPAIVASKDEAADFARFIGRSPPMLAVYERIRRMAPSKAPVFITGESGAGKELAAEAIHANSGGAGRPFVAINCSAIPRDLMESEIFGHVRGAFTGAAESRTGAAELADGGTLFLDELAEMDLALQAKLLRFVQTGSFRRVGGNDITQVTARLISATNREPLAEVAAGRLRADLFYRLNVLPLHLPPLRERREDIAPLANAFLARFAAEEGRAFVGIEDDAMELLEAYPWPGNVRELANVIRRIVVLDDGDRITAAMLPPGVRSCGQTGGSVGSFAAQERAIIEGALAAFQGSIPRAAAALEIHPSTIYRKLQTWPTGG